MLDSAQRNREGERAAAAYMRLRASRGGKAGEGGVKRAGSGPPPQGGGLLQPEPRPLPASFALSRRQAAQPGASPLIRPSGPPPGPVTPSSRRRRSRAPGWPAWPPAAPPTRAAHRSTRPCPPAPTPGRCCTPAGKGAGRRGAGGRGEGSGPAGVADRWGGRKARQGRRGPAGARGRPGGSAAQHIDGEIRLGWLPGAGAWQQAGAPAGSTRAPAPHKYRPPSATHDGGLSVRVVPAGQHHAVVEQRAPKHGSIANVALQKGWRQKGRGGAKAWRGGRRSAGGGARARAGPLSFPCFPASNSSSSSRDTRKTHCRAISCLQGTRPRPSSSPCKQRAPAGTSCPQSPACPAWREPCEAWKV